MRICLVEMTKNKGRIERKDFCFPSCMFGGTNRKVEGWKMKMHFNLVEPKMKEKEIVIQSDLLYSILFYIKK